MIVFVSRRRSCFTFSQTQEPDMAKKPMPPVKKPLPKGGKK